VTLPVDTRIKGTVSPDYKCLEVISIKSPLLGHVTPDIYKNFNSSFNFQWVLNILHQTHSNYPFYWNMNSVNTRSISVGRHLVQGSHRCAKLGPANRRRLECIQCKHYSSSKKKENWNVFGVVCLRTLKTH
jgi:hypothetical protein